MQLYQFSSGLNQLYQLIKRFPDFWSFRYKYIVDNSAKAEACTYAIAAARRATSPTHITELKQCLEAIVLQANALLEHINETQAQQPTRRANSN